MKSAVLVFPGINRERDIAEAIEVVSGVKPDFIWHRDTDMPDVDLIVVPGGFSYGDYLRAGAMAANSPVLREVIERAGKGVPVLGVCNGFQILAETGLLPGALMRNASLKFICRDVYLKVESSQTLFTSGLETDQVLKVPVAHHDGNYFADDETLDRLEGDGRVAFRYCTEGGTVDDTGNPNGSKRNIAGIFNETGTVLGMMPHPENAIYAEMGNTDGRAFFDGIARALG